VKARRAAGFVVGLGLDLELDFRLHALPKGGPSRCERGLEPR
jgi:hypothetical protein